MSRFVAIYISLFSIIFFHTRAYAQFMLGDHYNSLQLSGMVSTYYNHRLLKEGFTEKKKDLFMLKDAVFEMEGRSGHNIEYEIKVDFADLASQNTDPEEPGLMKAYITYKDVSAGKLNLFDISCGFMEVPYSRSALTPSNSSPFFSRTILTKGEYFTTRDVGFSISRKFWRNLIFFQAGSYTGLSNTSLLGKNDIKGNPEYIARLDFSFPAALRYRDVDLLHTRLPVFFAGINARYAEKATFINSDYQLAVVSGKKTTYGFDAAFTYMGFSLQYEIHQLRIEPENYPQSLLGYNTDYFLAGGWYTQANYYSKKLYSVFSCRFEEFDQNDLVKGNSQRFALAYAFLPGYDWKIAFRINYTHQIKEEKVPYIEQTNWTDEFRFGIQIIF